jgi:hypothetical protein
VPHADIADRGNPIVNRQKQRVLLARRAFTPASPRASLRVSVEREWRSGNAEDDRASIVHHSVGRSWLSKEWKCFTQLPSGFDFAKPLFHEVRRVEARRERAWRKLFERRHELENLIHHPVGGLRRG